MEILNIGKKFYVPTMEYLYVYELTRVEISERGENYISGEKVFDKNKCFNSPEEAKQYLIERERAKYEATLERISRIMTKDVSGNLN